MKGAKAGYALTALLMVLVFALAGAVSVILTDDYGMRIDLTEESLYTLGDETQRVLDGLTQQVDITVLNTEAEFPLVAANLLGSYDAAAEHISVHYVDPYLNPTLVQGYAQQGVHVEVSDLIVSCAGRVKQLKLTDLYELNQDGTQVVRLPAEQQITSAIDYVTRKERALALFTDGHGEAPTASLMELFETNHFTTSYAAISVLGIDENTQMLVICAPRRDFTDDEIAMVEDYLHRGGSVMVFLEPGAQSLERLCAFLADWGVTAGQGVVREKKLYVSASELNVAAGYVSHPINAYFTDNRYYVIMPSCMPLEQAFTRQGNTSARQVLASTGEAYALAENGLGEAANGPFALAMTAERTVTTEQGDKTGRLFVAGSRMMLGDDLMASPSVANRDFLVQAAGWCMGEEELLSIPAADMGGKFLPVVAGEAYAIAAVLLGAVPAVILLLGAAVWLRRRYL